MTQDQKVKELFEQLQDTEPLTAEWLKAGGVAQESENWFYDLGIEIYLKCIHREDTLLTAPEITIANPTRGQLRTLQLTMRLCREM